MDEQTFWALVDRIGHDPAAFDRLADELSDHGAADIRDFADHLARALHALDTPAHYNAVATSATSFLGVRCAAVAAGASAYKLVLSAPAALASYAGRPASQLLPVAERAFRTSTRGDSRATRRAGLRVRRITCEEAGSGKSPNSSRSPPLQNDAPAPRTTSSRSGRAARIGISPASTTPRSGRC